MSIQTDCPENISAGNQSPDYNFVPLKQIDFTSALEKNAFERYLRYREQLSADRSRPVTVNDIIHTANLYLLRTKDGNVCPVTPFATSVRKTGCSAQVMMSGYDGTVILPTDRIYMLTEPDVDKLDGIMRPRPVKLIIPVQDCIVNTLQRLGVPACYDFTEATERLALSADEFLYGLCEKTVYFAVFDSNISYEPELKRILPQYTGFAYQVGSVTSGGGIEITCADVHISLPLIKYSDTYTDICVTLQHCGYKPGIPFNKPLCTVTANSERILFVSSYDVGTDSEYAKGYLCVVSMICRLFSYGVEYTGAAYTFNNSRIDGDNIPDALCMVLGLFDAMLDYGITLRHCSDFVSDDKCFVLSALSPDKPFVKPGSTKGLYVYRLTPLYNENGLPDRDDFLHMLGYVSYLKRNNTVCSVSDTAPYGNPDFEIEPDVTPSEQSAALPGSLYIVTESEMQGRLLGKIKSNI